MKTPESHKKTSFEPLIEQGSKPQILILGSIPGDRSLAENQYYAHPQNRFWKVIASITNSCTPITYDEKRTLLTQNSIALWDVAHQATRPGSLDSAMRDETPNAISDFLATHPTICKIAFNGKKSEQLYNKFFARFDHLAYFSLPSTSPANAAASLEILQEQWKKILT